MTKKERDTNVHKVDLSKLKLAKDDVSYDVSKILSDALAHAIGTEDASRIERFIETMAGRSLGELAYDDVKRAIEYLELALGTSTPKVISELIKALINYSNCDISLDYERIDGYEALELAIKDLIKCLRERSKKIREITNNLSKELQSRRGK
ncbi:MAG: hypothetical protein B6U85_03555 [Desulfurococcales archaeon ex4484_42]|nr:MAG: hypothetical protein B6U85_03555 [Desulfurococcales archaeon ex4484_42]